jgi:hypothetical protein
MRISAGSGSGVWSRASFDRRSGPGAVRLGALVVAASRTSRVPLASETKKAHWWNTPPSRGLLRTPSAGSGMPQELADRTGRSGGMSTPGSAREGSGGRREMTPSAATDPTEPAATVLARSASIEGADAPVGTLKASQQLNYQVR